MNFQYRYKNKVLLQNVINRDDIKDLLTFSQDYYTAEQYNDTLVFNDLRFGQITGWTDSNARFAFYYFVNHPTKNDLITQRGRFKNWNSKTIGSLWNRMMSQ